MDFFPLPGYKSRLKYPTNTLLKLNLYPFRVEQCYMTNSFKNRLYGHYNNKNPSDPSLPPLKSFQNFKITIGPAY